MAAHLVKHRALRRQHAPVGLIGRVRAAENVERLIIGSGIGERPSVFAQNHAIVRVFHRQALEHGYGLRTLAGGPQRLGIMQRDINPCRIGMVLRAVGFSVAAP